MAIFTALCAENLPNIQNKTSNILPLFQDVIPIKLSTNTNPIGISFISGVRNDTYHISNVKGSLGRVLDCFTRPIVSSIGSSYPALFKQTTQEWEFSNGEIDIQTRKIGLKIDTWIFPFMQVFASAGYLNMSQTTRVGDASISVTQNLDPQQFNYFSGVLQSLGVTLSNTNATFHVGEIEKILEGWFAVGGANFVYDYKGFFLSCVLAGGYVTLNDTTNGIKNFAQHSFVYLQPRIGYSFMGKANAYFGIAKLEVFGENPTNNFSSSLENVAQSYSVQTEKFPIDFILGTNFNLRKDLSFTFEYAISPDTQGLDASIGYFF